MTELDNLTAIRLALYDVHLLNHVRLLPDVLNMMTEILEDFDASEVRAAIRVWNATPPEKGHKPRAPAPCELIGIMRPKPTARQQATEVANILFATASDIGADNKDKAQRLLPSIGMDVIQRLYGGWYRFVRATDDIKDPSAFKAQLRDCIEGAINSQGLPTKEPSISLPEHPGFDVLPVSDHRALPAHAATEPDVRGKEDFKSPKQILEMLLGQRA